ncbi:MAG TPA: radical SAM protein [bacterium]|nr:radical SAM protein [bacterium]
MKTLELEITDLCNEKCLHCYHSEKKEEGILKDLDKLDGMLAEFGDLGFLHIVITGGEPLLHPDFKAICTLAQKHRYLISIKTNGTLIDDDTAHFFKELKPKTVEISLYSADRYEHDHITQIPGSFEKSINGLKKLKNAGVKCSVMTPVLKGIKHWKELFKLMKEMGVPWGCSQNIHSSFDERAEVENFKGTVDSYLDFLQFVNDLEDQKIENIDSLCFKECEGGVSTVCVAPDYSVRACIPFPEKAGIYINGNGEELLKKARAQLEEMFAKLECHNCELVKYCNPCPAHMKIVDGVGICEQTKKEYVKAYLKFFS